MNTHQDSPIGEPADQAAAAHARRSAAYRTARDEYAAIAELRERNWIAAHLRERRYELELTQEQVADRAGTSPSLVSKVESGEQLPTIPVLQRIFAVLGGELLIGVEYRYPDGETEREIARAPTVSD